ncbi:uncharacterized protein [Narcine bancroftii]|uniref:uncharacterized protein n=1 Tax=Narcine bancroftii TaxID=1343680 RepID=UPI0038318876
MQTKKVCSKYLNMDGQVIEKGNALEEDEGQLAGKGNNVIKDEGKQGLRIGKSLKFIYFNARSIVKKVDELKVWIDTWKYNVEAISETWLQEGCDWQMNIPGFRCFRCDRVGGTRGDGVALLVRENITAVLRQDRLEGSSTAAIWVELRSGKGEVTLVGVYYRPPGGDQDLEEQICREIVDICDKHRVVIMGDFNFPHIDWETHSVKGLDGLEFVKCVQDSFLQQYVVGAVLDLLLANGMGQVTEVSVGEHFGSSDYNAISFNVIMERDKSGPRVEVFDWGKARFEEMRKDLQGVHWDNLFYRQDVVERWKSFKDQTLRVQKLYVPVRLKGGAKGLREPWFSRNIGNLVRRKREAYIRY